jgi:hypothetical protein
MKKAKIHPIDLEELMVYMTEKREQYEADDNFDIHQEFLSKFDITSEQLDNILSIILPMVDLGVSPLTNERYLFLADKEKGEALLKISLDQIIQKK